MMGVIPRPAISNAGDGKATSRAWSIDVSGCEKRQNWRRNAPTNNIQSEPQPRKGLENRFGRVYHAEGRSKWGMPIYTNSPMH